MSTHAQRFNIYYRVECSVCGDDVSMILEALDADDLGSVSLGELIPEPMDCLLCGTADQPVRCVGNTLAGYKTIVDANGAET